MINVIILSFIFTSIALITYLLNTHKIGSISFTTLFISIILSSLAVYGFDRLKILDLKNLRIVLSEIREVKKDVFAKAETVKKLGEEVAQLASFNATMVGRSAGDDLQNKMLEARDRITTLLKELGSDEQKIKSLTVPIEKMVAHDLASKFIDPIARKIQENKTLRSEKIDSNQIWSKLRSFFSEYTEEELENYLRYLQQENIDLQLINPEIKKYRNFLKTKKLE